jgi:antitoxin VapB
MSLVIENEEAERLAQELADITGESAATAVATAIRERLERKRKKHSARFDRLMAISKETAPLWKEPWKSTPHGDLLYDEFGLPKSD